MSNFIEQKSLEELKNSSKFAEIADLPSDLFNPYKLLIMNSLLRMDYLSFSHLKQMTKIKSDGNLASHLKYLEKDGYISVQKRQAGRYSKQFYQLTREGKKIFDDIIDGLEIFMSTLSK